MQTSGGPRGGEDVADGPDGTVYDLDVGDVRGRLARYEVRTDVETGESQAIFIGLFAVGA